MMNFNDFAKGLVGETLPLTGTVDISGTEVDFLTDVECGAIEFHIDGKWRAEFMYPTTDVVLFADVVGWLARETKPLTVELDEDLPTWAVPVIAHYITVLLSHGRHRIGVRSI